MFPKICLTGLQAVCWMESPGGVPKPWCEDPLSLASVAHIQWELQCSQKREASSTWLMEFVSSRHLQAALWLPEEVLRYNPGMQGSHPPVGCLRWPKRDRRWKGTRTLTAPPSPWWTALCVWFHMAWPRDSVFSRRRSRSSCAPLCICHFSTLPNFLFTHSCCPGIVSLSFQ